MNPHALEFAHGLCGVGLDGVGHGDHAQQIPAFGEKQRRFAFFRQRVGSLAQLRGDRRKRRDIGETAAEQLFAVQPRAQPVAGKSAEILDLAALCAALGGVGRHGPGERMLAFLLQGQRRGEELFLAHALGREQIGHDGLAVRDGPCLVEYDDLRLARFLKRDGGLEEDAVLRADAVPDHDRNGRGQSERAGAGDDQHGDGA